MHQGIKIRIYPTDEQKVELSKWMGASRVVWNAKCSQWKYESTYAKKYLPLGTYAEIDASYAQFKDRELTSYLYDMPAEIPKSVANLWRDTMKKWLDPSDPQSRPAKKKRKKQDGSVYLEKKLFQFLVVDNELQLYIGTKKFPVGCIKLKLPKRPFSFPNSLRVKKKAGLWWIAFCYGEESKAKNREKKKSLTKSQMIFEEFKTKTASELEELTTGIDRGIKIAAQTDEEGFDYTGKEKKKLEQKIHRTKKYQRRMARQKKGSTRREKTKGKLSRQHMKIANIRENFCHQTSHRLTEGGGRVIVMENLKTKNMTKKPKAKKDANGKWAHNGARRKAGLNKKILQIGWHKLENFIRYKSEWRGCLFVKVSPQFSSQECFQCGHIHPDNRKSQEDFHCISCGYRDNADRNAALVLKKRAIDLLTHSGSELSDKNVLFLSDIGRGAKVRRGKLKATHAVVQNVKAKEALKKTGGFVSQEARCFSAE